MKTILLLFFTMTSSFLFGQKTKIVEFGNNKNEDYEYKRNVIKTSPTTFIFGKQPIEFERELTNFLSLQAGVGVTFYTAISNLSGSIFSDFWSDVFDNCNTGQWQEDYCDDLSDRSIRNGKLGLMFSISPRLWFGSDGIDGSYVAPVLRYSNFKNQVQRIQEGIPTEIRLLDEFDDESTRNIDLVVHYGYQILNEVVTWEYFGGLGLRNNTRVRQDLGYLSGRLQNGSFEEKNSSLIIEFGLRVGFRL